MTNTDLDDLAAAVREIVRVLRPGRSVRRAWPSTRASSGRTRSTTPKAGVPGLHAGWYRRVGRYAEAPGIWRSSGVRIRVGANHLPLGLFLQTFLDAGLRLERIEEPEQREYPFILGLRWRR